MLVIGSPHANDQLDQAGVVHVLSEAHLRHLRGDIDTSTTFATRLTLPPSLRNSEGFDWFGWTSKTFDYGSKSYLAVGVPGHSESNSNKDVGAVILYEYDATLKSFDPHRIILGTESLGQFGKSIESVGNFLALGSPSEKVDKQWQTGCVRLVAMGDIEAMPLKSNAPLGRICGANPVDHFGWSLSVGMCGNLIVGARSVQDEAGAIYTVSDQGIRKIKGSLSKARLGESTLTIPWSDCRSMLIASSPSASKPGHPRTGMLKFYCANQRGECTMA